MKYALKPNTYYKDRIGNKALVTGHRAVRDYGVLEDDLWDGYYVLENEKPVWVRHHFCSWDKYGNFDRNGGKKLYSLDLIKECKEPIFIRLERWFFIFKQKSIEKIIKFLWRLY